MIRRTRAEDAGSIYRIRLFGWRETYKNIVPEIYLKSLDDHPDESIGQLAAWVTRPRPNCSYVWHEPGAGVVGFATGGAGRVDVPGYPGEIYALYILKSFQRRGIGRALVRSVAADLVSSGFSRLQVWVLRDNPERSFYEHLGGVVVAEQTITISGAPLPEWAYGFDATALASTSA